MFQNIFILRVPRVDIFAEMIKIVTMFIEKPFRTQKKLKESKIKNQNAIFICIS